MAFELPKLAYDYKALEPHIDAMTMEIHHTRHHAAYVNNLNAAIKGTDLDNQSLETILSQVSKHAVAVRNNGGGHWNHSLFWKLLSPNGGGKPSADLLEAINKDFGSFDLFREEFNKAASTRFGSGWAWLVKDGAGRLTVGSTPNQDNPLMDVSDLKGTPLLALDVWEHAYYLKYQNKRPDYIAAFWEVVNWEEVSRRFKG